MRGEPLGPQHLADLAPMLADPRVGATMGGIETPDQVSLGLHAAAEHWARDGFGLWMLYDRETGEPVGRGGLERTEFDGAPEIEVAWLIVPERWGQGLATELGAASVDIAFGTLGLPDVVAFTLTDNPASRRVMEKLGFAYEKTAPYKIYGDHVLYRLRAGLDG
jgi:[ribosomal protein S5]-alanine N-acetyltransferase